MSEITVYKQDHTGAVQLSYPARVLRNDPAHGYARVEAWFAIGSADAGLFTLRRDDRMVEHFWSGRFYNIFEVYTPSGRLKGFYCNVTMPATISSTEIRANDLELDLSVDSYGNSQLLDEADYLALELTPEIRAQADRALGELRDLLSTRSGPFAAIAGGAPEGDARSDSGDANGAWDDGGGAWDDGGGAWDDGGGAWDDGGGAWDDGGGAWDDGGDANGGTERRGSPS